MKCILFIFVLFYVKGEIYCVKTVQNVIQLYAEESSCIHNSGYTPYTTIYLSSE